MRRIVSETQELHPTVDTAPPTSAARVGKPASERLLHSLNQLPSTMSLGEALNQLVREMREALPDYSLALRIPASDESPSMLLAVPQLEPWPSDPWDPDLLLFPHHAHERRIPIAARPEPASLHCASNDPDLDVATSGIARTLDGCAGVISAAIRIFDAHRAVARRDEDLARMQRALCQSDKLAALGEISAGFVHELSNPLTSIIAYAEYLLQKAERCGGDTEDIERLRRVDEAAELILSYTRAIISYAKPDDDVPCPVDVSQVIDQSLLFCKHLVDDAKVSVVRDIQGAPVVRVVRTQLIQVIVNLVANACQAMAPQGGTLTVSARVDPADDMVRIQVDDTGPGIDPENMDRVFDLFFTTKAEGIGSGLGLNIVRQIVAKGHGTVSVQSSPGKGASFVVMLPEYLEDP